MTPFHEKMAPPWLAHSVILGVGLAGGYYAANNERSVVNRSQISSLFTKFKHHLLNQRIWRATVPWWLVLTCPSSPWYPLAVWFLLSTQGQQENKDETEEGEENNGNDHVGAPPFTNKKEAAALVKTRTAETRSDSLSLPPTIPNDDEEKPKRFLEMLVHNVSHTDLVLSVDAPPSSSSNQQEHSEYCLCRPRFSAFDFYCRRILSSITGQEQVVSFPRFERSDTSPRYSIIEPSRQRQGRLHTGFALSPNQNDLEISQDELGNLRFRGRDAPRIELKQKDERRPLALSHVFFPLLATLLPRWQGELTTKYANSSDDIQLKQVVVLVSGVGTPRNWTHSIAGNSTQHCAQLMKQFILSIYPNINVVCIHSNTNIFRYDDNIVFLRRELMPCINAYRDAHACGLPYPHEQDEYNTIQQEKTSFNVDWKRSFFITLSFADGSHARTHAIQTSLRPYRPRYYHLWQLKTFWHDTKIVEDDVEVHSFESMETVPAVDVNLVSSQTRLVIDEMKNFRNDFCESLRHDNDIAQFWLRKTKKPVLAVLLVQNEHDDDKPLLYRGTNMEVSMPTGSLCAERNVIGTALASNPALKRQDLKMVAVLAVPLELAQQPQDHPTTMPRSTSLASYSSIQEEETDWVIPNDGIPVAKISTTREEEAALPVYQVGSNPDFTPRPTPPGTPVRRITLYSQADHLESTATKPTMGANKKLKKTILVHSARDLNPLKPCGACNEWLKKIAESNPHFTVLTFTDADCNGVYVSPCDD